MTEDDSFDAPPQLNEEFEQLAIRKSSTKGSVFIPLEEITQMESTLMRIQENQSFAMWTISTLFSWLDEAGLTKIDPEMVGQMSNSLSYAMASQCTLSHQISSYLVAQRRDHYLQQLPSTITKSQKNRLAATSPFSKQLFDPELLEKITSDFKADMATSAQVAWTSLVSPPDFKKRRMTALPLKQYHNSTRIPQPGPSGQADPSSTSSAYGAYGFETNTYPNPQGI